MTDLLDESCWCCLCSLGCSLEFFLFLLIICKYIVSGQSLDTAHARSHTALRDNLKYNNIAGVRHMRTTTELL